MPKRSCIAGAILLCVAVAGCPAPDRSRPGPAVDDAPAAEDGALYPPEMEPGIALAVRRAGSRQYAVYGATDRATALRLSVEDGHNILFGPAEVPVEQQRFRIEFRVDATDRDHIFFYIEDQAGARLAVVPVDTAAELTTAGPTGMLPDEPAPGVGATGDRRTHVSAQGLESPRFRLRWPQVAEGDDAVRLQGETDLTAFLVEVRRSGRLLARQQPNVAGAPATWNAFATELRVPGGFREGDVIVLAEQNGDVELVFQPIRN